MVDSEVDLPPGTYDYDLFVLGGGSGGAAAALEAARRGRTGQVGVGRRWKGDVRWCAMDAMVSDGEIQSTVDGS